MKKVHIPRWFKIVSIALAILLVGILAGLIALGWYVKNQMLDSGGKLSASMAAYDIRHFDLAVEVFPADKRIEGRNIVTVETLDDLSRFEINLDDRLEVESVAADGVACTFHHRDGVIAADLPAPWAAGERHEVSIVYGGKPKIALRAPWIDGFVWSETPDHQAEDRAEGAVDRRLCVVGDTGPSAMDRGHRSGRRGRQLVAVQGPPV